jgi:hypothetical protein
MLIELTPELISAFELYLTTTPKLAHNTIGLANQTCPQS